MLLLGITRGESIDVHEGHRSNTTRELQDNLGVVTMNLGDTESSLRYLEAALAMRLAKLGPESLDVAATKDNLGLVYRQLNNLGKARELHNEVLGSIPCYSVACILFFYEA